MLPLIFCVIGYLNGSILFARVYSMLFHTRDVSTESADHNPGAANAFVYGGFACGAFTVLGDLAKGILPVYFFCIQASAVQIEYGLPFVLAAPVVGHIFPIFFHFQGGKGIAAAFGSYLGLWLGLMIWKPAIALAGLFLFFVLVVPLHPNIYLTAVVFALHPLICLAAHVVQPALVGSLLISAVVLVRLACSREPRPRLEVRFLWKR